MRNTTEHGPTGNGDALPKALAGLPGEKLWQLSQAGDEFTRRTFRLGSQETWDLIARKFWALLEAEAVALLFVCEDDPRMLERKAVWPSRTAGDGDDGPSGQRFFSWDRSVASHRWLYDGRGDTQLARQVFGQHYSSLQIALKDRKGHPLAVVLLADCLSANQRRVFTTQDEALAERLAAKAALLVQHLRTARLLRELTEEVHQSRDPLDVLETILVRGAHLLRARAGDLALWDRERGALVIALQHGASQLKRGQAVPPHSLMQHVFDTRRPQELYDAEQTWNDKPYHPCRPDIRSELAIPVRGPDGPCIGVLNFEFTQAGGFDAEDIEQSQLLATFAAGACLLLDDDQDLLRAVQRLQENAWTPRRLRREGPSLTQVMTCLAEDRSPPSAVLSTILRGIREAYGFEGGIVYVPDYEKQQLQGWVSIGCKGWQPGDLPFTYGFNERALATKVFREKKPYYSPQPRQDPEVNPRGVEAFSISGPLLGLPLVFHDLAVGALVVWGRHNPAPTAEHEALLQPFARLAAVVLGIEELHRRERQSRESLELANLGFFTRGLRHELKQILPILENDVDNYGRLAGRQEHGKAADCLGRIFRSVHRLTKIVSSLQTIIRPRHEEVAVSIQALLNGLPPLTLERPGDHPPELTVRAPADLPPAVVSPGPLTLALLNLIYNAEEALEQAGCAAGRIDVSAGRRGDRLVFEVRDNGPGLLPEQFQQATRRWSGFTTKPGMGLGFGLELVRRVAALHGGSFLLQKNAEGGGLTAVLDLPFKEKGDGS